MRVSDLKMLIIDDEPEVGTFFRRLLKHGYEVTVAVNGAQASEAIRKTAFNVAMVDLKLPDADGLSLLQQIKELQPSCEVIIMTGYSTSRTAVKAIQLGAFDYLEKPFEDIGEVEQLIRKAADYGLQEGVGRPVEAEWIPIAHSINFQVGTSQVMHKVVSIAYKIAKKNINVLIQGETGTGKEVLARFIHAASNRSDQIFIPVNCGALPENLLESELFGHEKGAFTGAGNLRRGIFEMANQGTLFLDEVEEASPAIQVKLLRVLETGEFFRLGGEHPIKTNVRVIAASNVDLEQAMKRKMFRQDLFYRLDVVRLELPPLRRRQEDVPLLAEYFLKKQNPGQRLSSEAVRLLRSYTWPGNIRDLSNTIRQAAALCDGKTILKEHLGDKLVSGVSGIPTASMNLSKATIDKEAQSAPQSIMEPSPQGAPEALAAILKHYFDENTLDTLSESNLAGLKDLLDRLESGLTAAMRRRGLAASPVLPLKELEATAIRDTLDCCQGNVTRAAQLLGIGRNTLYRKMKDKKLRNRRRFSQQTHSLTAHPRFKRKLPSPPPYRANS